MVQVNLSDHKFQRDANLACFAGEVWKCVVSVQNHKDHVFLYFSENPHHRLHLTLGYNFDNNKEEIRKMFNASSSLNSFGSVEMNQLLFDYQALFNRL